MSAAARPSAAIKSAALILAIDGVLAIAYSPFVPLPFMDSVVPFVNLAIGGALLLAAVEVWRLRRLGRLLGIVLSLWGIATVAVALASAFATTAEPWSLWFVVLWSAAQTGLFAVLPLWILLRRWPDGR